MVNGFKFQVGDAIVPLKQYTSSYLRQLVIHKIHIRDFCYEVIDLENDVWRASPLLIENEFKLKGKAEVNMINQLLEGDSR